MTEQDARLLQVGDLTRFEVDLGWLGIKKGDVLPVSRIAFSKRAPYSPQVWHMFPDGWTRWTAPGQLTLVLDARLPTSLVPDVLELFP